MKVIGIISSPSREGNTAALVLEALRAASEQGAEVVEVFLPGKKIEFCRGCFECMAQGRCPIDDDLEEIKQALYESDGIILGSPTYGLDVNAIMKNFFDRVGMYSVYTSALSGKYVVGFSTAGGFGADKVAKKLTNLVNGFWGRGFVSGSMGVIRGWQRVDEMPQELYRASELGRKLVDDIREKPTYPLQNLPDRIFTRLFVRKFILENVLENKEGTMKAVYTNLLSQGLIHETQSHGQSRLPEYFANFPHERISQAVRPLLSAVWSH